MRRALLLLLILAQHVCAATGDIVSVTVGAPGWYADVVISGLNTGGTYAMGLGTNDNPATGTPKITFTVVSLGFDATGAATTITRTIYGTSAVRKAYSNQASNEESNDGTNTTVRVALSDYIFQKDATGGGNSGTAPTVNILAGFYTKTAVPNNASSSSTFAVTNSSTVAYPRVVANWSRPPFQRITSSTFPLGAVAFHSSGRNGKPVACVVFTATDTSAHTATTTVTAMSVDSTQGDAVPVCEYVATMDASTLTQGNTVTCNFKAYPWVGDSASTLDTSDAVNSQPTPLYAPITCVNDKSGSYGVTMALVDPTGSDGGANTVYDSASFNVSTAYKFLTIGKAAAAIASYNNTNRSRNTVGEGVVYLNNGTYAWAGGSFSYGTAAPGWLTITRSSTSTNRASVIIGSQSGDYSIGDKLRLYDITVTITNSPVRVWDQQNYLWFDYCTVASNSSATVYRCPSWYFTRSSIPSTLGGMGLTNYGNGYTPVLIRGNDVTGIGTALCYTWLGNKTTASGSLAITNEGLTPVSSQPIFAYNKLAVLSNTSSAPLNFAASQTSPLGIAVVQNLFEYCSTSGQAIWKIAADGTTNTPINNVLLWQNTTVGNRINRAYNDTGSASAVRTLWSEKNNIFDQANIKADIFTTANAARIGNWPVMWGVGASGNLTIEATGIGAAGSFGNQFYGLNCDHPTITGLSTGVTSTARAVSYAAFRTRACYDGSSAGSGNGDYHPLAASPVATLQRDFLLPYDLAGATRGSTAAPGCYIIPAASFAGGWLW